MTLLRCALALLCCLCLTTAHAREQWSVEQANAWYAKQPWMAGANYLPRSAINQLEMFQAETFDAKMIDEEFGWAESLGYNVMRVYLHDLLWEQDAKGFLARLDQVLAIADKHGIRLVLTIFDSCWLPAPKLGKQPDPKPHVHNSGWVQSPGLAILGDPARWEALKPYVIGVVGRFKDDPRVMMWDVFNEFDNGRPKELPDKPEKALGLAKLARAWALSADPLQPVTTCIWMNHTKPLDQLAPWERFQIEGSDVINFHIYSNINDTRKAVEALKKFGRPLICTEYMARPTGSTFKDVLPFFKAEKIAAINWGFVDGKSQTKFPWDSSSKTYPDEPEPWFHDVLRRDGTPYRADEVELIRKLTGKAK